MTIPGDSPDRLVAALDLTTGGSGSLYYVTGLVMLGGGGAIALGSLALVIVVNGFTGSFAVGPGGRVHVSYRSDTVIAVGLGLAVCLGLAAAYAFTREAGFMVVAGGGAVLLPALAVPLLTQKHPLQLAALFALIGAVVLGVGFAFALGTQNSQAARTVRRS